MKQDYTHSEYERFVSENHPLICSFLRERRLDQSEFYDVVVFGFLNAAGFFVGVRSGLCDVISTSRCKKIILYEKEGYFYRCSPYDYFSLEKMRLCQDAVEFEYHADTSEAVIERILEELNPQYAKSQ